MYSPPNLTFEQIIINNSHSGHDQSMLFWRIRKFHYFPKNVFNGGGGGLTTVIKLLKLVKRVRLGRMKFGSTRYKRYPASISQPVVMIL